MARKKKAVVLGVGAEKGLGAAASRRFAKEGYRSAWTHEINLRPYEEPF